jgi:hypothetical protein
MGECARVQVRGPRRDSTRWLLSDYFDDHPAIVVCEEIAFIMGVDIRELIVTLPWSETPPLMPGRRQVDVRALRSICPVITTCSGPVAFSA